MNRLQVSPLALLILFLTANFSAFAGIGTPPIDRNGFFVPAGADPRNHVYYADPSGRWIKVEVRDEFGGNPARTEFPMDTDSWSLGHAFGKMHLDGDMRSVQNLMLGSGVYPYWKSESDAEVILDRRRALFRSQWEELGQPRSLPEQDRRTVWVPTDWGHLREIRIGDTISQSQAYEVEYQSGTEQRSSTRIEVGERRLTFYPENFGPTVRVEMGTALETVESDGTTYLRFDGLDPKLGMELTDGGRAILDVQGLELEWIIERYVERWRRLLQDVERTELPQIRDLDSDYQEIWRLIASEIPRTQGSSLSYPDVESLFRQMVALESGRKMTTQEKRERLSDLAVIYRLVRQLENREPRNSTKWVVAKRLLLLQMAISFAAPNVFEAQGRGVIASLGLGTPPLVMGFFTTVLNVFWQIRPESWRTEGAAVDFSVLESLAAYLVGWGTSLAAISAERRRDRRRVQRDREEELLPPFRSSNFNMWTHEDFRRWFGLELEPILQCQSVLESG